MTDPNVHCDLRLAGDERLREAAEGLVAAGCVSEVRVHQNGSILTGIIRTEGSAAGRAGTHRVYILDEAQIVKNPRARVSQAAGHRLCLTGTPVENHLGELWSLFAFAEPGLLGDEREFQRRYRPPIEKNADRLRAEALAAHVAPCLLRRTKDAVARELPPKSEIVETIVLGERQRDFYDAIRLASHRHIREILERQGLERSQITILDALLRPRQACCDPRLVAGAAEQTPPSAKLEWLAAALPELAAEAQATDRAHRIGQTRPVFIYKLIAQNTVEERMLALQAEKRALTAGLYAGAAASPLALTTADVERLLTA